MGHSSTDACPTESAHLGKVANLASRTSNVARVPGAVRYEADPAIREVNSEIIQLISPDASVLDQATRNMITKTVNTDATRWSSHTPANDACVVRLAVLAGHSHAVSKATPIGQRGSLAWCENMPRNAGPLLQDVGVLGFAVQPYELDDQFVFADAA